MNKTKKILTIALISIAALMIVMSGIMKITKNQQAVEGLTKVGVGPYITLLGTMEIVFAALFVYPKTMKLGFILLSCYFAGAMATDLSHGSPVVNAMFPLVLIWIAAFLRDKSVFLPTEKTL